MLIVTTNKIEGHEIKEIKGLVRADAYVGTGLITAISLAFANTFGIYSHMYEKKMNRVREAVLERLKQKANEIGANAIIGYKETHNGNSIGCVGTGVFIEGLEEHSIGIKIDEAGKVESIKKPIKKKTKINKTFKAGDIVKLESEELYSKNKLPSGLEGEVKEASSSLLLVQFKLENGTTKSITISPKKVL